MVSGVGTDLLEIGRLERALERRPRLAERLFSADELAYAAARARPGRHLAARFAAKEAVVKALGVTSGVPLREIEVVVGNEAAAGTGSGAGRGAGVGSPPTVRLSGAAARAAAGRRVLISLSHSEELASAFAVAEEAA